LPFFYFVVVAVQNARQVMEVCRMGVGQVDLILAEVELPKKRGFKLLKCFMKEEGLKQIPIVSKYLILFFTSSSTLSTVGWQMFWPYFFLLMSFSACERKMTVACIADGVLHLVCFFFAYLHQVDNMDI
jgi:hypothetical protein